MSHNLIKTLNALLQIYLISGLDDRLPFSVEDANRPETEIAAAAADDVQYKRVLLDTRLNNRVIDLRVSVHNCLLVSFDVEPDLQTQTNQAVFKIQHAIGYLFREYLDSQGFIEIHTPKLQGAATESGASVFKVGYFKGMSGSV